MRSIESPSAKEIKGIRAWIRLFIGITLGIVGTFCFSVGIVGTFCFSAGSGDILLFCGDSGDILLFYAISTFLLDAAGKAECPH